MKKTYNILSSGKLSRHDNTILYESSSGEKKFIPIETVDEINIFGEVSLNTKFIDFISRYDIVVHFYNYYGFYVGSLVPRKKNVSGFLVVEQAKRYINIEERLYLAKAFVEGAMHNMARNLSEYNESREERQEIQKIREQLYEAMTIEEVMSFEGAARKQYYKAFGKIIKNFEFKGRVKRPPKDVVNTLISFLNSLMYTAVLSEIYKTQLDPSISYLHEPSEKRYSLSLDISEIFKPIICDKILFRLTNLSMIKEEDVSMEEDICYLTNSGKKKLLQEFSDKLSTTVYHRKLRRNVTYREMIRLECYKLLRHIIGDEVYKPLKAWW